MMQFEVDPRRMALLTIDVQNVFVQIAADAPAVVERINRLAEVCRAAGIPVIHVRHAVPAGAELGILGEMFPPVREGMLDRTSETAALHESLVIAPSDELLEKPHFGAFYDTDLQERLEHLGVDTIIIAGIETNVCCETTAREAMVRDIRAFFVSDATTTGGVPGLDVAEVQRASLAHGWHVLRPGRHERRDGRLDPRGAAFDGLITVISTGRVEDGAPEGGDWYFVDAP